MSIAKHIIDVFEGERIPLNERDPRYHYYEIRHDEEWEPATVEKKVLVNFWGTIATDTDLGIEGDGYYSLTEDDLEVIDNIRMSKE